MDFCKEIFENFQKERVFLKLKSNQNIVLYSIMYFYFYHIGYNHLIISQIILAF